MLVKEFYKEIGGDYEQVFNQLGDDEIIVDFLKKFFDKNELKDLKEFLSKKKYKEAFMNVHNMKGYGLNMALTPLHKSANILCEALRNGKPVVDIKPMIDDLESTYNHIEAIFAAI